MSDTPNIDIRQDHWQIVRDILRKHVPQYEVWAFGSRAKWLAKQYSDLDLAIITDQPLSLAISAALADDFSESDLPWKVDVVDWATTVESFRKIIERDKVVVKEGQKSLAMKDEIYYVPLRDLTTRITKGTTPSRGEGFVSVGINYIKSESITSDGTIDTDKFAYIDKLTHDALARSQLCAGNVLFSMAGVYLGKTAIVRPEHVPANANQAVGIITPDQSKADPRFIHYSIQSPACRSWIKNSAAQSAQPNFNLKEIGDLPIPSFSLEEQRRISNILGALDDKIELNRRSNQTLEAMARALFKSWFVDFDGVSLDDMQESELGLIPKGWRAASLDSIAHYLNGLALQKFPPESEAEFLPVIKIAQLRAGHAQDADKASTRLKSEYIVQDGDVLFSWSGTLEVDVWTGGRGALNQHLFKVTSTEVPKWFYYFATRQHLPDFRTIAAGKATTMGHIQRKHLADAKVAVPPTDAMGEFDRTIAPLFEQIINNALQSRTLAQQRDILLPKLISGEFRVRDVKCFLEKAK
ncbi:restriction endonuclease subunit S [Xanthomonas hortorum]|uniref:Restriction endonuclease subunit S n=1 Tax=Xanthomonas hortorum pv. hederae TaxID=453603 RepID=A0A9X4BVM7_9XANT|nr:restriction endonuclease subunit S [Xanthomonas hortorum]MCE4373533.1 restriction endonuclease subunit S [Xanthomonas hortorum pv. hederae]MDC8640459.1 restriction endonuclease subunit S [Xanthomonas hortorum pv. hederae]PPU75380.1 restriction endonuclease [Xanthomonas hortorum pv. hederae]PUE94506.1 restriction endonuclease [Xanthomonas hortorum pv. hederae]